MIQYSSKVNHTEIIKKKKKNYTNAIIFYKNLNKITYFYDQ